MFTLLEYLIYYYNKNGILYKVVFASFQKQLVRHSTLPGESVSLILR